MIDLNRIEKHIFGVGFFVLCMGVFTSTTAFAKIRGTYRSPMGTLSVKEHGGVITGRIQGENPCGFKKGKVVFEGTRLDDSLTGTVMSCKVGPGCKGKVSGMMMLLITRSGKTLTGAVHLESGKCKTPVGEDGFTVRKIRVSSRKKGSVKNSASQKNAIKEKKASSKTKMNAAKIKAGRNAENAFFDGNEGVVDEAEALRLLKMGATLLQENKVEEAREAFKNAVEKNPELAKAHTGIGVTYYIRGRYDETLEAYKRALEANPADGDIYYNMACIYALKRDLDQAINYLRIAALNGFVDWHVFDEDDDLKALYGDVRFEKLRGGDFNF